MSSSDEVESTAPVEPKQPGATEQSGALNESGSSPTGSDASESPELAADGSNVSNKAAQLLDDAEAAINALDADPAEALHAQPTPFRLQDLVGSEGPPETASIELLRDVDLDLRIELGRTHMYLEDVLKLRRGSVVTLDKLAGDPVDLFANGRLVARGEILVLNDNFCVRVAELIGSDELMND